MMKLTLWSSSLLCLSLLASTSMAKGPEQDARARQREPVARYQPNIISETETGITIEAELTTFNQHPVRAPDGTEFVQLSVRGCGAAAKKFGWPEMPFKGFYLEIPYGVDISVDLLEALPVSQGEGYKVYPLQAPQLDTEGTPPPEFRLDKEAYSSDSWFPENPVALDTPVIMRGRRLVFCRVSPLRYNPKKTELQTYQRIRFRVAYERDSTRTPVPAVQASQRMRQRLATPSWEPFVRRTVLNYAPLVEAGTATEGGMESYLIIYKDDDDPQYDLEAALEPLKEWKEKKGFKTIMVPMSTVGCDARHVQCFITNAYNTWQPPLTYVLLVGDHDDITARSVTIDHDTVVTDQPYACVQGADYVTELGIGRLPVSTSDECADVVRKILKYDRLRVSQEHPVYIADWYEDFLIAAYFQDCPPEEEGCKPNCEADRWFMETAMLISGCLEDCVTDPTSLQGHHVLCPTTSAPSASGCVTFFLNSVSYGGDYRDALLEKYWYPPTGIPYPPGPYPGTPPEGVVYRGGQGHRELPDPLEMPEDVRQMWIDSPCEAAEPSQPNEVASTNPVVAAINCGIGLALHRNHGNVQRWANPLFTGNDIAALQNFNADCETNPDECEERTPVVFSINCSTGTFHLKEEPGFCETFLRRSFGGCVGIVGPTGMSASKYNDVLAHGMIDYFWPTYDEEGGDEEGTRPWDALEAGKLLMEEKMMGGGEPGGWVERTIQLFHWFGDPEMMLRTKQPGSLLYTKHDIGPPGCEKCDFRITVLEGESGTGGPKKVGNAMVSLSNLVDDPDHPGEQRREVWSSGLTRKNGQIVFHDVPRGRYDLVVTASNSVPLETEIGVGASSFVPYDFATIQDAVDQAQDGDVIMLADGTYTGRGNYDIDLGGKRLTLRSLSGDPGKCIIGASADDGAWHRVFHFQQNEGEETVIAGITITNGGNLVKAGPGGGILCEGASPTIRGCKIVGCGGSEGGGLALLNGSAPRVVGCVITGNYARGNGGGVYLDRCLDATINQCTITNNKAKERGGGLFANRSNAVVSDTILWRNSADVGGSDVWSNAKSSVSLRNCDVDFANVEGIAPAVRGGLNISQDPRFVAPAQEDPPTAKGDYSLRANSPCSKERKREVEGGVIGALGVSSECTYIVCPDGSADFRSVQAAIDGASDGDIICLCDGTFSGPGNRQIDYKGKRVTIRSQSGNPKNCIIDCENQPVAAFLFHSDEGRESVLQGIKILKAGDPNTPVSAGGAISCDGACPTIKDCRISCCTGVRGGAVSCVNGASPAFTGCIITGNRATEDGAGIYISDSSPELHKCTISANFAEGRGGGIWQSGGHPILRKSILRDNAALKGSDWFGAGPAWNIQDACCCNLDRSALDGRFVTRVCPQGQRNVTLAPGFLNAVPAHLSPTALGNYHLATDSQCLEHPTCGTIGAPALEMWPCRLEDQTRVQAADELQCGKLGGIWIGRGKTRNGVDSTTGACCKPTVDGTTSWDCEVCGLEDCECSRPCELEEPVPVCLGDVDGNGSVTEDDVAAFEGKLGATDLETRCRYDLNCDGTIDQLDVELVDPDVGSCSESVPPPPHLDLSPSCRQYYTAPCDPQHFDWDRVPLCLGDVNGDGAVTSEDSDIIPFYYPNVDLETRCRYDLNCDGRIDDLDLQEIKDHYGSCVCNEDPPPHANPSADCRHYYYSPPSHWYGFGTTCDGPAGVTCDCGCPSFGARYECQECCGYEGDADCNGNAGRADEVEIGAKLCGTVTMIGTDDPTAPFRDEDWFKFTVPDGEQMTLKWSVMSDFASEVAITASDWQSACASHVGNGGECVLNEVSCGLSPGTYFAAVRPDVDGNGGVLPCTSENNRYVASLELIDGDVCGACCYADDGMQKCRRCKRSECEDDEGVWHEGLSCDVVTCPSLGACCYWAPSTAIECLGTMTHVECWNEVQDAREQGQDRVGDWWYWRRGYSCEGYSCVLVGACCALSEGDDWQCYDVGPFACLQTLYGGRSCYDDGFVCPPDGACCVEGVCTQSKVEECEGQWFIGELCDDEQFQCPGRRPVPVLPPSVPVAKPLAKKGNIPE